MRRPAPERSCWGPQAHSSTLADELVHGKLDIGFLRVEKLADLEFKVVAKEPLVAILPSDHRLAQRRAIDPHDLVGETYIGISRVPRVLRGIVAEYFKQCKIEITPSLEVDN